MPYERSPVGIKGLARYGEGLVFAEHAPIPGACCGGARASLPEALLLRRRRLQTISFSDCHPPVGCAWSVPEGRHRYHSQLPRPCQHSAAVRRTWCAQSNTAQNIPLNLYSFGSSLLFLMLKADVGLLPRSPGRERSFSAPLRDAGRAFSSLAVSGPLVTPVFREK